MERCSILKDVPTYQTANTEVTMVNKKWEFDEEKLVNLIQSYDYCQDALSAEDARTEIKDFIDQAVRDGKVEVLNQVTVTHEMDCEVSANVPELIAKIETEQALAGKEGG